MKLKKQNWELELSQNTRNNDDGAEVVVFATSENTNVKITTFPRGRIWKFA
jgi:hypothetical protein